MQSIDVLGNHRLDLARVFQLYDRMVHWIGSRCAKRRPGLELVVPMLDSSCLGSHEVLVIYRPATSPNAIRSPEIGDSASSRDASAGKDHHSARFSQKFDQVFELSRHFTEPQIAQ